MPQCGDRKYCDLLWVPTGTGKTEAYLGLAIFVLAYRRRKPSLEKNSNYNGLGTAVLTRYTLRLLTIQQFRRTLKAVTACEFLRIQGLTNQPAGWRPVGCKITDQFLWGTQRFSIGLWVGGELTPNSLLGSQWYEPRRGMERSPGAIDILRENACGGHGEPAQVINCPVCGAILSIPDRLEKGLNKINLVFSSKKESFAFDKAMLASDNSIRVINAEITPVRKIADRTYFNIALELFIETAVSSQKFDLWWNRNKESALKPIFGDVILECARPSRPGYFIKTFTDRGKEVPYDFEIFCTNQACELNREKWCESNPSGVMSGTLNSLLSNRLWSTIILPFRDNQNQCISIRIPIPAYTVDDQVYHRCPSIIVATVDKFARLPFEPKSAAIFGNVGKNHRYYGYYNEFVPPKDCFSNTGYPIQALKDPRPDSSGFVFNVNPMEPPDLIIQDELHLIEGPLGSLVGLYETAIDSLSTINGQSAKYVASTATIRKASEQVLSVFRREVFTFPPPALNANESFFLRSNHLHILEEDAAGRLYVGVNAPGKGAQTPIIRLWAILLQYTHYMLQNKRATTKEIDPYWTIVGYFNAIRELAGATALYKQDVIGRLRDLSTRFGQRRVLNDYIELSSPN